MVWESGGKGWEWRRGEKEREGGEELVGEVWEKGWVGGRKGAENTRTVPELSLSCVLCL